VREGHEVEEAEMREARLQMEMHRPLSSNQHRNNYDLRGVSA